MSPTTKRVLAGLVVLVGASLALHLRRQPDVPPHVLVYLIDTLRADHLGCYGYERDTSPRLDALAEEGVLFRRAQAQSSWTKPSVASLFTGLLPTRHGAVDRAHSLPEDVTTLAELLAARGYTTAAFLSNPNVLPVFGFGQGFDHVVDIESEARSATAADVHAALLAFLEDPPAGPLFLYVHTRDPHDPYDAPAPFGESFLPADPATRSPAELEVDRYDGEIAYADHELGKLVDRLHADGLFDASLFVLLSDHGEEFGEHGGTLHGRTLFEEQLHVPLLLRFPGGRFGGRAPEDPVRVVDLLPTIAELVGAEPPAGIDGRSFLALATGSGPAPDPVLFAELSHDGNVVRSLTDGRYKLIERRLPRASGGTALYDLAGDPGETVDLARADPERTAELSERLAVLESGMTGGIHLELVNAAGLEDAHRVSGRIVSLGDAFLEVEASGFVADEQPELTGEGRRIELDVLLENRPNPIGQEPLVLKAKARLRFELPQGTPFRVELAVDGTPLRAARLILGRNGRPEELPLVSADGDPRLELSSRDQAGQPRAAGGRPFCRLFQVPRPAAAEVDAGAEIEERLRALGYVGEE